MNSSNYNKLSLFLSIFAIVISALAIYLPYKQQQDILEREYMERLNIQIGDYGPNSLITISNIKTKDFQIVYVPHIVQITNTGNRKVAIVNSIIEIETSSARTVHLGKISDGYFYSNDKKVKYPITIDVGETELYTLNIGYLLPKDRVTTISENLIGNSILKSEADLLLKNKNIDIFGDSIKYLDEKNLDSYIISYNPETKDTIRLDLTIGNGKSFSGRFKGYVFPLCNHSTKCY